MTWWSDPMSEFLLENLDFTDSSLELDLHPLWFFLWMDYVGIHDGKESPVESGTNLYKPSLNK